jgi:multidrug efflux pump subunit AcrA (membrane-fusion protein)
MSIALSQTRPATAGQSIGRAAPWALMGLLLAVLIGYIALDLWNPARLHASQGQDSQAPAGGKSPPESKAAAPASTSVTLSESKFQKAKIATEPARIERLTTEVGLVGMVQANADRQVEVRPRASGIVREVHVRLGQKVKQGQPLVVLDSPEVGKARLDLRARQRELATARYEANWKREIAANVKELIPDLEKGIAEDIANRHKDVAKDPHDEEAEHGKGKPARTEAIEIRFAGKDLGAYRGTLLQAFADYEIAVHEEEKNVDLQRQHIVGAHPVVVARHTREGMQAKLTGEIEQARYISAQEQRVADQAMKQAEAAVVDAAQRLRILGVTEDIPHLLAHPEEASKLAMTEDVTRYQIDAPFDGHIMKKHEFAAPSQKADMNDVLLVLADLRTVWVKADVPEWRIAELAQIRDDTIQFRAKAYSGREFQARLISIGSAVDPQTRTVPILAETENPDGLLKVGMFVNILLGSSSVEEVLTVPSSAVVEIDAAKYVFIPADKPRTFSLRPVEVGRQAEGRTVIRSGLVAGETIVASGAFFLKSELILQHSEEDE